MAQAHAAGPRAPRRCAQPLTRCHARCACRCGHLWHQGGHDAGAAAAAAPAPASVPGLVCAGCAAASLARRCVMERFCRVISHSAAGAVRQHFRCQRSRKCKALHCTRTCNSCSLPACPRVACRLTSTHLPQFFKDGAALPATVIALEAGNIVTQVKSAEKDGYTAVQVRPLLAAVLRACCLRWATACCWRCAVAVFAGMACGAVIALCLCRTRQRGASACCVVRVSTCLTAKCKLAVYVWLAPYSPTPEAASLPRLATGWCPTARSPSRSWAICRRRAHPP